MKTTRGPLRSGARVGSYVVREEIGFGATSVVYEAEHRTLRHRVAVKVLRSSSETQSELRWRFDREMQLCSGLTSKHVPRVYEVGELPSGLPYIVMELLRGATLGEWLAAHGSLPIAVVVEIGIQLCTALSCLHARSVVHRDVKPDNLVLHQLLEGGYVLKLVDFGICKPLLGDGRAVTQQGTVVGTPEYMSPEQVQGIEVDPRTDVYSAGAVLYELFAGRPPFQGRDLEQLGRAILFRNPPRLSTHRAEVSAVLEGIVMRAMARDRSNRHPSIQALRHDLERFADAHGLRRHPHVWALLPARELPKAPPPPPRSDPQGRAPHPTLITRIPVRRSGVVGSAAAGLGVFLAAVLSIVYVVHESTPVSSVATEAAPLAPRPRKPAASPIAEPVPLALELPPALDVRAAPVEPEPASAPSERARARRERRARRAAREASQASTTVAFEAAGTSPAVAGGAPSISAAEIYAQVDALLEPLAPAAGPASD